LLAQSESRPIQLSDTLPIQSGLKSFELAGDQGGEMEAALSGLQNPAAFHLSWFNHPIYGDGAVNVTVTGGKFIIKPDAGSP
jgi:hypothetical protein